MASNKIESLIKQITYQSCEMNGHETEPLSRICIDKQCKNKTLICAICEQEKHKDHETTPLKNFLLKFYTSQKQKKSDSATPLYYANKIDETRNSFFSAISQFRAELTEILSNLETKAQAYFNSMSQKLLLLVQFQNPINVLRKEGIGQAKLKKYFEQILEHTKLKQKFCLSEKLAGLLQKSQEKQKQLSTTLGKVKAQSFGLLNKLQKSLDISTLNTLQKTVFKWSEELKGTKMKINGNIAEQTGMESSGQRFIMLEPSLADESQ